MSYPCNWFVAAILAVFSVGASAQIAVSGIGGGGNDLPCWTQSMDAKVQGGNIVVSMSGLCVTHRDGTVATAQIKAGDTVHMMGVGSEFPSPNDLTDDSNVSGAVGTGQVQGNGGQSSVTFSIPVKQGKYAQVLIGWVDHKGDRTWLAPAKVVNGVPDGATVVQSHGGHQINAIVVENGQVRLPTTDEKVAVCQATPAIDNDPATNPSCTQKGTGGKPVAAAKVARTGPPPPPKGPGAGGWKDPDGGTPPPPPAKP